MLGNFGEASEHEENISGTRRSQREQTEEGGSEQMVAHMLNRSMDVVYNSLGRNVRAHSLTEVRKDSKNSKL